MRLLIHHRLWGKEPTRRYQTRAQPWQLQAAMSAFFHASHTIRASRTPWSFCFIRHLKDHRPTPQYMLVSSSRYQSQADPLRLIKKVISLDLAQNKRTPCIPADRQWGPAVAAAHSQKPNSFKLCVQLRCEPTFVVWCMYLHTREHDALLQPALPTILHRPTAPNMRRTEEGPSC